MKWVKFRDEFTANGKLSRLSKESNSKLYKPWEREEIKEACFKIYDNLEVFKRDHLNGEGESNTNRFHKWIRQRGLPEAYFEEKYSRNKEVEPNPYEIYIGGWLHFYDTEVQNGNSDHAVYFDWDYKEKEYVTVYILQLIPHDKILNIHVNVNITNPPGSQDPPTPKIPPPYC